jgi:NADPH-dependent 2,4-dienoyl-CoA reductase/sulfur reductase-like enzyme
MEAARIAAGRGHQVVLCEKGAFLGGLVPLAAVVKDLETEDLMGYVHYLETQLRKENVTVRLKTAVTPEVVRAESPDVLVLAAGAAYAAAELPGEKHGKVLRMAKLHGLLQFALRFLPPSAVRNLSRLWMPLGESVVILGGELHGCELAEFLVKRGRKVAIVHNGPESELGDGMTKDDVDSLRAWFRRKQVAVWFGAEDARVVPEGLEIRVAGRGVRVLRAESVIPTQDLVRNTGILEQLAGLAGETHVIGSCKEPGLIVDAVREGALIGYAV